MRTLRMSLAGTLTMALLAITCVTAVAQADAEPRFLTHVTGMVVTETVDTSQERTWVDEIDGHRVRHVRDMLFSGTIEWSDPRLPADSLSRRNFEFYDTAYPRSWAIAATGELRGPDGYWTSEFVGYLDPEGAAFGQEVLVGHDAYEGLYAILSVEDPIELGEMARMEGYIFEGEMPPMPDPVEPPATE